MSLNHNLKGFLVIAFFSFSLASSAQNAIKLTPVNSYIQIPDNAAFHFTGTVTYEVKVRLCSDVSYYVPYEQVLLINCINPDQWGFYIGLGTNRNARTSCIINGGQYTCNDPDPIPADNQYHTISGVRSGTQLMVYLDGVLKNTITVPSGNLRSGAGINHIGRAQVSVTNNIPAFVLKDARFWNTARTQNEIQNNLNTTLSGNETGLVGLYTFNQASATGNGITITNSAVSTGAAANGTTAGTVSTPQIAAENLLKICTTPFISVKDASTDEGDSLTHEMKFKVSLSNAYDTTVTVKYKSFDSTAAAATDYIAVNGTLKIKTGKMSKTVSVFVNGDTGKEKNEVFKLSLSNALNAIFTDSLALGKIKNDDTLNIVAATKNNKDIANTRLVKVSLSPNPAANMITLTGITLNGHIEITDISGKVFIKQNVSGVQSTIHISILKQGIYFMKYSCGANAGIITFRKL